MCPATYIDADADDVWALVSTPEEYELWQDVVIARFRTRGPAWPGQRIGMYARALHRWWPVTLVVERVDAPRRRIDLRAALPLGIAARMHIAIEPLDRGSCRARFGCDFAFPPRRWGWVLERSLTWHFRRGVGRSLARLKAAAENRL